MKVLIAEDDRTTQAVLKAMITNWGFEVVATSDGEEAWAAMQQEGAPEILILDWMMPGLDGPALCRRLRNRVTLEGLYIILLTSKCECRDIVSGLENGADDFINKPFHNDELRARMNVGKRIIELRNKLREKEKLQGVLEMAGAVCHELNQPLQAVSGYAELIMMNMSGEDPNMRMVSKMKKSVDRIGRLTKSIMGIYQYKTKSYVDLNNNIVDIDNASIRHN